MISKLDSNKRTNDEEEAMRNSKLDTLFVTILMVPYTDWWQIMQCFGICVTSFYATFNITFYFYYNANSVAVAIYYLVEVLFFIDVALLIINRNTSVLKKKMYQKQQHVLVICICALSILPISEVYEIKEMFMWYNAIEKVRQIKIYVTTKVILRLVKVILYYLKKRYEAGINQLVVILCGHVFLLILMSNLFGSLWFLTQQHKDLNKWTSELTKYAPWNSYNNRNNTIDKFLISYTTMANILACNWSGYTTSKDIYANILIILAMLLGHMIHTMLIFGLLTVTFVNKQRKLIDFSKKIKIITKFMENQCHKNPLLPQVKAYYNELWEKRSGVKSMPECFKLLPPSLQKEVTVDIFWDMYQHSHLFAKMDMGIKREVSLVMKTEFLLPGDYLFRRSKMKMKMVFIVSGVIQVLSDDDDDSPLLSLSSGSILGEYNLLYGVASQTNLRSATYCELQVLYLPDLYRVLLNYRSRTKILQDDMMRRVKDAQIFQIIRASETVSETKNIFGHTFDTSLRRLKKQWHTVFNLENYGSKSIDSLDILNHNPRNMKNKNELICSKYLNLIVLSNEIELKVQAIFLKGDFPFVLDPDSEFNCFIEYLCLASVIAQYFILPYYTFFGEKLPNIIEYLLLILDAIYFFDIMLQATTAIKEKNHLITDSLAILSGRFKQLSFIIDIVATIPYDVIVMEGNVLFDATMYLKLPRLLKVYKLIFLVKKKEQQLEHYTVYMRLLKYIIICICVVYFITCLLIITFPNKLHMIVKEHKIPVGLISAYYTLLTYTEVGLFERLSYNIACLIIMHIATMLSYFMYGLCFAELTSIEILFDRMKKIHKTFVTALNKYMDMRVFPIDISTALLDIIKFQWNFSKNSEFLGKESIISDAPVNIQKNVIARRIKESIGKMFILQQLSDDIIKYVFQTARYFVFNPGAVVVKCNSRSAYMYIILRGYCNIESSVPGDKERGLTISIKKAGDSFPVVEVLHDVNTLINVTTVTAVEAIMLPAAAFRKMMMSYPKDFNDMFKALQAHKMVYSSILHKLEHKVPLLNKVTARSLGPGEYFKYRYDELNFSKDERKIFVKPYQVLGIFSMIRYFALPKTINPTGTFFTMWETIRCIFAITHFILVILYMNVLFYHINTIHIVFTILNLTAYADLYIRCHCQFYDNNGILVTHPFATTIHYFKNGFTLDLIGVVPFDYVYLQNMFRGTSDQSVKALLYLLTRPFQLHRVFRFVHYMLKRSRISENYIYYFQSVSMLTVLLLVASSITQLIFCWSSSSKVLECNIDGCIAHKLGTVPYNNHVSMLLSLYLIISIFTASTVGSFETSTYTDLIYLMILVPLLTILHWVTYAKLTSKLIQSENTLTKSQNDIKSYLKFVRSESITGHIVDDLVDHYEHEVKKDHNTRLASISYKFSPQLHEDIAYYDYGRALVESAILNDLDVSIIKYLCTMFSRHFVKKDSQIIKCNDVNDRLYFIWRGKVQIRIANCKVATIGPGGMFGCLARRGYVRQTISATAVIHVELISIKSDLFNELVDRYPVVRSRIDNCLATNIEYMSPITVSTAIIKIQSITNEYKYIKIRRTWHQWVNHIFNQQARWYKIFDYILNVHLAPLSCMAVVAMQVMPTQLIFEVDHAFLVIAAFFSIKLFLGFNLTYVDPESGITVTNKSKICKRYLKEEFFIDLISILPIQLCLPYIDTSVQYSRLFYTNYLIRIVFLIRYYNVRKNRLNVENHLRWTFMIYITIFSIQSLTSLWKFLACKRYGGGCTYMFDNNVIEYDNGTIYSTILAYTYLTNLFTHTGLQHVKPLSTLQIGISLIIAIFCFLLTTILSAGFATSFIFTSYAMSNFDHEIENIKAYFISQNLSPPIHRKVWIYYLEMWKRESGQWTPSVIKDAPGYLQQNLLQELYGHHLSNHVLFSKTHVDFLRQLVVQCKRCVYLPGYSIVEAGDVDNTIYFVHSGVVEIIGTGEYVDLRYATYSEGKTLIREGSSFGEEQGLFNTPHKCTYRAYTVVDIILLNYKHWKHLIPWFPASHEEIVARAKESFFLPTKAMYSLDNIQLSQA